MRTEIERYARVYAEVDLDAVRSNVENMKAGLGEAVQMTAVVKTDGYGHGAVAIARELEPLLYLWGFATATAEEAGILRTAGITKPILILGYTFPYCYEYLAREHIRPAVFSAETARRLSEAAYRVGSPMKIHVKVDTGMSRIGIPADARGLAVLREISAYPNLEIEGIFTHFAKADEKDKTHAGRQLSLFRQFVAQAEEQGPLSIPIKHCANSAALLEMPEANLDMVRAGIALYGLLPSCEMAQDNVKLTPAMSLISHIAALRELGPGCGVSYGAAYITQKNTKVATIPAGYGDGYPRGLSGKGYVLIHGQRAPILGRICMDQFMVDVTDIPGVCEGDMATLIGADQTECITMEQLGDLSGRFHYELACDIGKRVPRVYVKDGKAVSVKEYRE